MSQLEGTRRFRPALSGWAAGAVAVSASVTLTGCGHSDHGEGGSLADAAADAQGADAASQPDAALADALIPTGGVCPVMVEEDARVAEDAGEAEGGDFEDGGDAGEGGATGGICPV
jgi:hypothetical protein